MVRRSGSSPQALSFDGFGPSIPEQVYAYPQLRFMGSKYRLLPWFHRVFADLSFTTALDAFCGSGSVSYLLKAMGKEVTSNDFLNFSATIARAVIENSDTTVAEADIERLVRRSPRQPRFIETTFSGIFFDQIGRASCRERV